MFNSRILITIRQVDIKKYLVSVIDVDNDYYRLESKPFDTERDADNAASMLSEAHGRYCNNFVKIEKKLASHENRQ